MISHLDPIYSALFLELQVSTFYEVWKDREQLWNFGGAYLYLGSTFNEEIEMQFCKQQTGVAYCHMTHYHV